MLPNFSVLFFFGGALVSLWGLGEYSRNPGYFAFATVPIIYLMSEINQPLFTGLGYCMIAFTWVVAALYYWQMRNGR